MLSTIYLPHCNSLEITASLHLSTGTSTCTDPDATIATTLRALLPRLVYGVTYRLQTTLRPLLPLLVHDVDATCTSSTRTLASLEIRPNCNYNDFGPDDGGYCQYVFTIYCARVWILSMPTRTCFLNQSSRSTFDLYLLDTLKIPLILVLHQPH